MGQFDGRVAFITGAARGQGRSHAVRLAEEGANIVAVDLCQQIDSVAYPMSTPDDLQDTVKLVEDCGSQIVAKQADVRDIDQLKAAFDAGVAELGAVDIVLPNAGILNIMGEPGTRPQAWFDALDVMLTGVYHAIEVAIPSMIENGRGGSIVITSSTAGLRALTPTIETSRAGALGYHAAKHGVLGLMKVYANVLAQHSIRVNTVHPTGVATPMVMNEAWGQWATEHPELLGGISHPLPVELVEPVDISNAIVWLCSEQARYITGVSVPVDAGLSLR
jgi:SDR family mycofactocin-dependent oxidoreductase